MGPEVSNSQACVEAGGLADHCRRILEIGAASRDSLWSMTGESGAPVEEKRDSPGEVGTVEALLNELQDQANEISGLVANIQRRL